MDRLFPTTGQHTLDNCDSEIIFVLSLEGIIIYAPSGASALTGYSETELPGLSFPHTLICAADSFIYETWVAEVRDHKGSEKFEINLRIQTRDDGQIDCHCKLYHPKNDNNIICVNIFNEVLPGTKFSWPLRAAIDCPKAIQRAASTGQTIRTIFGSVSEFVTAGIFDAAWITPIKEKVQKLSFETEDTNGSKWHPAIRRIQKQTVARQQITVIPIIGPLSLPGHYNGNPSSFACVPLLREGKLYGLLNLFKTDKDFFTDEAVKVCESIGEQISFAIGLIDKKSSGDQNAEIRTSSQVQTKHSQMAGITGNFDINFNTGDATWSEEVLHIYGLPKSDSYHSYEGWLSFVHPDDIESVKNLPFNQNSLEDTSFTFRIIRPDKTIRHIAIYYEYEFNKKGKAVALFGTLHDITDIKTAEIALQHSEQNLRNIIDSIPQLVYGLDRHGRFIFANESFALFYGRKPSDLIGKYAKQVLVHPDDSVFLSAGHSQVNELTLTSANHVTQVFSVINIPYTDSAGSQSFIGIAEDITSRKSDDAIRLKLMNDIGSHNRDLEQFSYIVSHNLRSPVANIIGLLEELHSDSHDFATRKVLMEQLNYSVLLLDQIVIDMNTILEIKNINSEKIEVVRFPELIHNIENALKEIIIAEEVKIHTDFSAAEEISGFKGYLYNIFQNLISNSIKFRNAYAAPKIKISTKAADGNIVITYSDNGLGIDTNKHGHDVFGLYKRFHNHKPGKGLGLYLIKNQIEAMGGSIKLKSTVGTGTTFHITLPQ